jgi:hypothetical protein
MLPKDILPKEIKDDKEKLAGFVLGSVGCIAILIALGMKGVTGQNILDAIKDIAGLGTILFVAVIAVRARKSNVTLKDIGESLLEEVQRRNESILTGPEYSNLAFTSDSDKAPRMKYLFFKRTKESTWKKKVAFIPLDFLADGILDIRVSKATLVNLGIASASEDVISNCQTKVQNAVKQVLQGLPPDQYKVMQASEEAAGDEDEEAEPKPSAKSAPKLSNSAITITFRKDINHKTFAKTVFSCTDAALKTITSFATKC